MFSFFRYKDLYGTLSFCPEVKINMTVMYQSKTNVLITARLLTTDFFSLSPPLSLFVRVSEINRVRKDMYSDTVNGLVDKHPLELPEPVGPIVHLQEKLFVPVKEYPDVSRPPTSH